MNDYTVLKAVDGLWSNNINLGTIFVQYSKSFSFDFNKLTYISYIL